MGKKKKGKNNDDDLFGDAKVMPLLGEDELVEKIEDVLPSKGKSGRNKRNNNASKSEKAQAPETPTEHDVGPPDFTFTATDASNRLDHTILCYLGMNPDVIAPEPVPTRSGVQRAIKLGGVSVNGATVVKPSLKVKCGDEVGYRKPQRPQIQAAAEDIPLDIVYEDEYLIVINKPAGMTVHPAKHLVSGTLVNALLHHVGISEICVDEDGDDDDNNDGDDEGELEGSTDELTKDSDGLSMQDTVRPGIVHRLDRETSGLIVVAKDDATHANLSGQFAKRTTIDRKYLAIVWGTPSESSGRIEGNIARDPGNRKRMAVVPSGGKHAATNYETVETFEHAALLSLKLETGRTHQIRVHCGKIGHLLFGDHVYGGDAVCKGPQTPQRRAKYQNLFETTLPRHALHAAKLGFIHPRSGKTLTFTQPMPKDMEDTLKFLRAEEPGV